MASEKDHAAPRRGVTRAAPEVWKNPVGDMHRGLFCYRAAGTVTLVERFTLS